MGIATIGTILRIFAIFGNYDGSFWVLALGETLIGIATVMILLCAYSQLSFYPPAIRTYYLSSLTGSVSAGIFMSMFLCQSIFIQDDLYFYNSSTA